MFKYIKINSLTIEGFKGYKEKQKFDFADIVKIIADNGKGKTSIGEAISWAFLGTDLWGSDKMDSLLLNNRSKKMEVTIDFSDGEKDHFLKRSRLRTTTILLDYKSIKQSELTPMIGSKEIFLSIFNPEYFTSLSDTVGRDFLIHILPNISIDDILTELDEFSIQHIRDSLEMIHNNPNLFMKERRSSINGLETDLVFNEGSLSKIDIPDSPREFKSFDCSKIEELQRELEELQFTKFEPNIIEYDTLNFEKRRLEKEKIALESKEFSKVETIEEFKELANLEKDILLNESKNFDLPQELMKEVFTTEAQYNAIREEYKKKSQIPLKKGNRCPVCRTSINHTHLEMLKVEVAHELDSLVKRGQDKAKELSNLNSSIELMKKEFNTIKEMKLRELREKYNSLSLKIKKMEEANITNQTIFQEKKEKAILNIQSKINNIEQRINDIKMKCQNEEENHSAAIKLEKEKIKEKIIELNKEKALVDAYNIELKIHEENREKGLIEKNRILEENVKIQEDINFYKIQIEVCKKYTNQKIQMLSQFIQKHLADVTIVLQKIIQNSGELKDCFEIKYMDRNYKTLSRSQKIKVGIEISNLIRNITTYNYPIFVDNAESITKYKMPNNAQLIETKVVEDYGISVTSLVIEHINQYQEILNMSKSIRTIHDLMNVEKVIPGQIEINDKCISEYTGEPLKNYRILYGNLSLSFDSNYKLIKDSTSIYNEIGEEIFIGDLSKYIH
ncbi:hypothetical protein NE686_18260 [Tissierella carlieri]|uniref:Nuclease SbcCD subunit C n=1 Tax=Tissierella carlieri TaxID=689904 RepID=A0ABT1SF14_9FIRM|nr:hypothetical protein [Tissierella carlieri]MCQ4925051.1 hypothetical protein [Tissierella carlieri]